jgi:hypothetical protein
MSSSWDGKDLFFFVVIYDPVTYKQGRRELPRASDLRGFRAPFSLQDQGPLVRAALVQQNHCIQGRNDGPSRTYGPRGFSSPCPTLSVIPIHNACIIRHLFLHLKGLHARKYDCDRRKEMTNVH